MSAVYWAGNAPNDPLQRLGIALAALSGPTASACAEPYTEADATRDAAQLLDVVRGDADRATIGLVLGDKTAAQVELVQAQFERLHADSLGGCLLAGACEGEHDLLRALLQGGTEYGGVVRNPAVDVLAWQSYLGHGGVNHADLASTLETAPAAYVRDWVHQYAARSGQAPADGLPRGAASDADFVLRDLLACGADETALARIAVALLTSMPSEAGLLDRAAGLHEALRSQGRQDGTHADRAAGIVRGCPPENIPALKAVLTGRYGPGQLAQLGAEVARRLGPPGAQESEAAYGHALAAWRAECEALRLHAAGTARHAQGVFAAVLGGTGPRENQAIQQAYARLHDGPLAERAATVFAERPQQAEHLLAVGAQIDLLDRIEALHAQATAVRHRALAPDVGGAAYRNAVHEYRALRASQHRLIGELAALRSTWEQAVPGRSASAPGQAGIAGDGPMAYGSGADGTPLTVPAIGPFARPEVHAQPDG